MKKMCAAKMTVVLLHVGGEVEMHRLVHFDKFFSNFFCLESHFETSAKALQIKVALIFIERFK